MSEPTPYELPFTVIVPTVYGQMLVNRHDINQTNALFKTGQAIDHEVISMLLQLLAEGRPSPVVVDVGANFGAYTLAFAKAVGPHGRVYAFEAQRMIYYLLAGSVALNSRSNVHCMHTAIGDHEGSIELPQYDYDKPMNFGSVELGPVQRERLPQERTHLAERSEKVRLTTLDCLELERIDLMKIDVEGMEMEVLAGAQATIARCRPTLFVEFLKSDAVLLKRTLEGLRYEVFSTGSDYLALPKESALSTEIRAKMAAAG